MQALFSAEYAMLWALLLALALYYPVRQLIWGMAVRRAQRKGHQMDEEKSLALKRRASITAVLLCFVFSIVYTTTIMKGGG